MIYFYLWNYRLLTYNSLSTAYQLPLKRQPKTHQSTCIFEEFNSFNGTSHKTIRAQNIHFSIEFIIIFIFHPFLLNNHHHHLHHLYQLHYYYRQPIIISFDANNKFYYTMIMKRRIGQARKKYMKQSSENSTNELTKGQPQGKDGLKVRIIKD